MDSIDLSALTLVQAFGALITVAALDIAWAYIKNAISGTFDFGYVAVWVQSHVLARVFPIFALFILGHGISIGGEAIVVGIAPAWAAGLVALTAYLMETANSIVSTQRHPGVDPTDNSPAED